MMFLCKTDLQNIKQLSLVIIILICLISSDGILAGVDASSKDKVHQELGVEENPLLQNSILPRFDKIKPEHFEPAIEQGIKENKDTIEKLLAQKKYTWDNFIAPLDEASERISIIWDTVRHLNDVIARKEVRDAYEKCVPAVTKHFTEIKQDVRIYQAIEQIFKSKEYGSLNSIQKKIISDKLRDF
ncbi:MAG: hypothetical protein KKE11_01590, partial [Gammaproteobacteria bacterium]|nr:hypothetical protein [Gammaproteobacteria bacterium]